jgi:branched-chain amino acid transport system substrate-binding protein
VVGGDSYDDPGLFSALGTQYGSDIYFVTHSYIAPGVTPDMQMFMDLYQKKYGKPVDTLWVATGWDAIMVLTQAMEKAGSTDGAAMAKAMENNEFSLLTGKLKWSDAASGHTPDIEAPIVQLTEGKTSFIGWFRPAYLPPP